MTIITINERTKAGKMLLEFAKIIAASNKGVTIDLEQKKTPKTKEKSPYNPEFVNRILSAEKEKGKRFNTAKDLWESII